MADIQLTTTTTAAEILFGGCFQSGIVLSRQESSGDNLSGAGEEGPDKLMTERQKNAIKQKR